MTNEQAIKVLLDEWKCIDRNDGINCDRQCEKCDLVMDSAILKDAYNTAIQALEKANRYDDKEHYVTISKALYDKLNIDYEALSQEPMREFTEEEAKAYSKALDKMYKPTGFNVFNEPCDTISRILQRMWNCRGKHTTSIDKVKMEQIIREELSSVTKKTLECNDTVSRGVFEQVMRERDIAIEQLHELGYELGQKIEPLEVEAAKLQHTYNKGFEDCRQAVLDGLKGCICEEWTKTLFATMVKQLPSVNPQPSEHFINGVHAMGYREGYKDAQKQKLGKWITKPHVYGVTYCSECDFELKIDDTNYCPNCGSAMKGD